MSQKCMFGFFLPLLIYSNSSPQRKLIWSYSGCQNVWEAMPALLALLDLLKSLCSFNVLIFLANLTMYQKYFNSHSLSFKRYQTMFVIMLKVLKRALIYNIEMWASLLNKYACGIVFQREREREHQSYNVCATMR